MLNIHAIIRRSRVNGPGTRLVVFFQGCRRGCAGCFNPDTHSTDERLIYSPEAIIEGHLTDGVEGLTVSGGEPFLQVEGLIRLLRLSRARGLTNLVFSGYQIEEIQKLAGAMEALGLMDVLIDGPFIETLKEPTTLARGSTNQRVHLLTPRYSAKDLVMPGRFEINISPGGIVTETGFGRTTPGELNT